MNYYQFVNRYRIEKLKIVLMKPGDESSGLVGIVFEVGFNSNTVFNTTFKKLTGNHLLN